MSAKSVAKKSQNSNPATLYRWNIWLSAIFAVQGLAILLLSAARSLPITVGFLGTDTLASQGKSQAVLASGTHHLLDVNLAYVVAAFLFMAAISHGLVATKLRDFYEKNLKKSGNTIRWVEYAASASTMLVSIALVVGMRDLRSLVMLFVLNALMNLSILALELRGANVHKDAFGYVIALMGGVVAWLVLGAYLISSQVFGNLPGYITVAYFVTLLFFVGFGWNAKLQLEKKGKWADFVYGERMFMIWGLLAKTALAWLLFVGALRP